MLRTGNFFLRDNVNEFAFIQTKDFFPNALDEFNIVGRHDNCCALGINVLKKPHNVPGNFRIQVAGRLIGQNHSRRIDDGARNGHPLLLAAG